MSIETNRNSESRTPKSKTISYIPQFNMSTTRSKGHHDVESVDDFEGTMRADYLGGRTNSKGCLIGGTIHEH